MKYYTFLLLMLKLSLMITSTCAAQSLLKLKVPSNQTWTNTGVHIEKDQKLNIIAKGKINWFPKCNSRTSTPKGTGCPNQPT